MRKQKKPNAVAFCVFHTGMAGVPWETCFNQPSVLISTTAVSKCKGTYNEGEGAPSLSARKPRPSTLQPTFRLALT